MKELTWTEQFAVRMVLENIMDKNIMEWDTEEKRYSVGDRVVLWIEKEEYLALKRAIKKLN